MVQSVPAVTSSWYLHKTHINGNQTPPQYVSTNLGSYALGISVGGTWSYWYHSGELPLGFAEDSRDIWAEVCMIRQVWVPQGLSTW